MFELIKNAQYKKDYQIEVNFINNEKKVIDLEKFVTESKNPLINQFSDKSKFKNFEIDKFGIEWDNEMSISAEDIYQGVFTIIQ